MATQADVRRLALALPQTVEEAGFAFAVAAGAKPKAFVWAWKERVHPKRARVPSDEVVAVRVADEAEKQLLLAADPAVFFTEPHYNGFPAVLVRLAAVTPAQLRGLLAAAWRCQAPRKLRETV